MMIFEVKIPNNNNKVKHTRTSIGRSRFFNQIDYGRLSDCSN